MDSSPPAARPLDAGERALLGALARDIGPRLLTYVRRGYGTLPEAEAEDIVAETFYRAAANIPALRCCDRKDLYLLTIARNLCRDRFRRLPVETRTNEELNTNPALSAMGLEPVETAMREERHRLVGDAVAALPEAQREIVVLRLSVGLKFEEIAELLAVPLGTALSRMHAALRSLKDRLGCVHER